MLFIKEVLRSLKLSFELLVYELPVRVAQYPEDIAAQLGCAMP